MVSQVGGGLIINLVEKLSGSGHPRLTAIRRELTQRYTRNRLVTAAGQVTETSSVGVASGRNNPLFCLCTVMRSLKDLIRDSVARPIIPWLPGGPQFPNLPQTSRRSGRATCTRRHTFLVVAKDG